jgi:hypothetical protein
MMRCVGEQKRLRRGFDGYAYFLAEYIIYFCFHKNSQSLITR